MIILIKITEPSFKCQIKVMAMLSVSTAAFLAIFTFLVVSKPTLSKVSKLELLFESNVNNCIIGCVGLNIYVVNSTSEIMWKKK